MAHTQVYAFKKLLLPLLCCKNRKCKQLEYAYHVEDSLKNLFCVFLSCVYNFDQTHLYLCD